MCRALFAKRSCPALLWYNGKSCIPSSAFYAYCANLPPVGCHSTFARTYLVDLFEPTSSLRLIVELSILNEHATTLTANERNRATSPIYAINTLAISLATEKHPLQFHRMCVNQSLAHLKHVPNRWPYRRPIILFASLFSLNRPPTVSRLLSTRSWRGTVVSLRQADRARPLGQQGGFNHQRLCDLTFNTEKQGSTS